MQALKGLMGKALFYLNGELAGRTTKWKLGGRDEGIFLVLLRPYHTDKYMYPVPSMQGPHHANTGL